MYFLNAKCFCQIKENIRKNQEKREKNISPVAGFELGSPGGDNKCPLRNLAKIDHSNILTMGTLKYFIFLQPH